MILLHLFDVFPSSYTDDKKGVVLAYASSSIFLNIIANPIIYAFKIRRVKRRIQCMINNISSEARVRNCKLSTDSEFKEHLSLNMMIKGALSCQQDFNQTYTFSNKTSNSTV